MSEPKTVAGKWGPVAFALSPVADTEMLRIAADDMLSEAVSADSAANDKYQQYMQATDETLKDTLWSEYEELTREYRVLIGWYHVTHAVHTFAIDGCKSKWVPCITEIEIVPLSMPEQTQN